MASEQENFWSTGRIIATIVVVALIATLGYTLFSHADEGKAVSTVALPTAEPPANNSTSNAANAKAAAPPDFDVKNLDGGSFKLSSYKGKVLVLDFWAVWCPPCREEVPQLVRIAREQKERGVEVVGLHIDDKGRTSQQGIRNFVSQFNINYTVGIASDDMFIAYLGEENDTIPQTLVFDRNGKVIAHLIGYDDSHAAKLDAAINKAIAGS
ncbi:MAG: TlpA disulfide reductase family protein [Acidobacteriota bacterium]